MTADRDQRDDLAVEQARNERYLQRLRDDAQRVAASAAAVVPRPASAGLVGFIPRVAGRASGALIGRVALDSRDPRTSRLLRSPCT